MLHSVNTEDVSENANRSNTSFLDLDQSSKVDDVNKSGGPRMTRKMRQKVKKSVIYLRQ